MKNSSLVSLKDTFKFEENPVELTGLDNDKVSFRLNFSFLKKVLFSNKVFKIKIEATDKPKKTKTKLIENQNSDDINKVFYSLRNQAVSNNESVLESKEDYQTIFSNIIDLTKFINNLDVNSNVFTKNEIVFVDSELFPSEASNIDRKKTSNDNLSNVDVSIKNHYDILKSLVTVPEKNEKSIQQSNKVIDDKKNDHMNQVLDSWIEGHEDISKVPVFTAVKDDFFPGHHLVELQRSVLNLGSFYLYLDFLGKNDKVVFSEQRNITFVESVRILNIEKNKIPRLSFKKIDRLGSKFFIGNLEDNSLNEKFYVTSVEKRDDSFFRIDSLYVDPSKEILIPVNKEIFCLKSYYKDNIVLSRQQIKKERSEKSRKGIVYARQYDNVSILIEVYGSTVGSNIKIYRKDLRHKRNEQLVFESSTSRTFFDSKDLLDDHTYQYHAIIENPDGESFFSKPFEVTYRHFNDIVGFRLSNVTKINDVNFNINVVQKDTKNANNETLLELIRNNQEENFFQNKLISEQQISKFGKFINYKVRRIRLSDGRIDNLGVVVNGEAFSDIQFSKKRGLSAKEKNVSYLYEISPFLIDKNQFFDEKLLLEKEYVDYQKFYSDYGVKKSLAISKDSIQKNKNVNMFDGLMPVCPPITLNVPGDETEFTNPPSLSYRLVKQTQSNKIMLSWDSFFTTKIDCFIVNRIHNQNRVVVGIVDNNNLKITKLNFIDVHNLRGNIRYSIVPVTYDGRLQKSFEIDVKVL